MRIVNNSSVFKLDEESSIFKQNTEYLNLLTGLICTLFCIYSYFLTERTSYELTVKVVIILSGIHGGLSYSNLIVVKDVREILFKKQLSNTLLKLFYAILFISVPLVAFEYYIGKNHSQESFIFFIRNYIISYASIGHYYKQLIGYNAIYNENKRSSFKNKTWLNEERSLLNVANHIAILVFPVSFSEIAISNFKIKELTPILILIPAFILIYIAIKNYHISKNKSLYLLRGISFTFFYHNPISIAANKIIHSIEYLLLSQKILSHEKTKFSTTILYNLFIIFLLVFIAIFIRWGIEYYPIFDFEINLFLYLHLGLSITLHIWADNIFYSMKNPEIRKVLGPRLTYKSKD